MSDARKPSRGELTQLRAENAQLRASLCTLESCLPLLRCLEPAAIYPLALEIMLEAVGAQRGVAVFRRAGLPNFDGLAAVGFDDAQARALRRVLAAGKPIDLEAIEAAAVVSDGPAHALLRAAELEIGEALAVPLCGCESERGVLWLLDDGQGFDREQMDRAGIVTRHALLALENAERYQRAKERAFVDDVTEVYNARFLLQAADHEIQRAQRYGRQICVLFLDLDHFKLVNDNYGHLVGSDVLRQLSRVLLDCIRQVDTLARYGGDEFTILLVDSDLKTGLTIAERIRSTVARTPFESDGGQPIQLTISIGVAAYPQHGRDRSQLLDVADKAMYRAKSLGRNCVCSASELAP